ncbi:polysaccharide biosynthesis/export family protein, partial [Amylibacter sp.]|nr:polysaccharide biosynthesis/export family protein [Amylibacter sp.]
TQNKQEDLPIKIKPLNFSTAKVANQDPYPRTVSRNGRGSKANIFNEADFFKVKFPSLSKKSDYHIGIGDELFFSQKNEYLNSNPSWPEILPPSEYRLGVGDELMLLLDTNTRSIYNLQEQNLLMSNNGAISTGSVVGTDGNVLLYGIGNITAKNRSLAAVRTEIRNILIRNGQNSNFQLEISKFKSKKAYVTTTRTSIDDTASVNSKIVPVDNIPITLRQIALSFGVSHSSGNLALVTLTRNSKKFHLTAKQLLDPSSPEVYIKNKDQIEIKLMERKSIIPRIVVGSQGRINIPIVGRIKASGKTLENLHSEVSRKIIAMGIRSNFQLDIITFNSKKVAIINDNGTKKLQPLTDRMRTLQELALMDNPNSYPVKGFLMYSLRRGKQTFQISEEQLLNDKSGNIWLEDGDQIKIESLLYKPDQVFALSGSNNAQIVNIDPSNRETLADILFVSGGVLSNSLAQRSEVYLVRNKKPSVAYHLDVQHVSRLLVAAQTELRPNDIIFVAERPIISFARTLSEISPLRILLRDIQNNNIP